MFRNTCSYQKTYKILAIDLLFELNEISRLSSVDRYTRISKVHEMNGHLRITFYKYLLKRICEWFETFGHLRYLKYIYNSTKHKCDNKSKQFAVALSSVICNFWWNSIITKKNLTFMLFCCFFFVFLCMNVSKQNVLESKYQWMVILFRNV